LDDDERLLPFQDQADARRIGQRHGWVGRGDPQQRDAAQLDFVEDLQGVCGWAGVGDVVHVDLPQLGEFGDVVVVGEVAESRQVSVRAALPVVLGGGLAVHLQHAASRSADQTS